MRNKNTKRVITVLIINFVVLVILAGVIFIPSIISRNNEEKELKELERDSHIERTILKPFNYGFTNFGYISCIVYERETGYKLTSEDFIDYLSQRFEDDGTERIFSNGRHPEIASYIEWTCKTENLLLLADYYLELDRIYEQYTFITGEQRAYPVRIVDTLPIEILDELIKKEADSDYEIDLYSIQNRYINEGKAIVLEDSGLEYITAHSE